MCQLNCFNCFNGLLCRSSEKRVSAVAISHNGAFLTFADKFGVVWVVDLERDDEKAAPLLAHYCSIITSLVRID